MKNMNMNLYKTIMNNINESFMKMKLNEDIEQDEEEEEEEMTLDEYWQELIDHNIATEDELQLVTSINGYNLKTLNDVLEVRTGNRSWDQYKYEQENI